MHRLSLNHKIPPPVVAVFIAFLMWSISPYALTYQPLLSISPNINHLLAIFLVIFGAMFDLSGLLAFRRSKTTINPLSPDKTSSLVTLGIYRFTRNPMYVGIVLFLLAWTAFLSSWLLLVGPVIFVIYINRFQIAPEEQVMEDKFGDEYRTYKSKVRRWP